MKEKKITTIYFTEKQDIKHFWIRIVLLFEVIVFSGIIYRQLIMGKPVGPYPVSDSGLVILSLLFIIPVGILFLIKIKITVSRDEICYKMIPMGLFKYKISHRQLKNFSIETKSNSKNIKTYGLKLELKNKKSLFLPSRKPKSLLQAVERMVKEHDGIVTK